MTEAQETLPAFDITATSDSRTQVELKGPAGAPALRLIIDNGYLDLFRAKVGERIATKHIVLFTDEKFAPYFGLDRQDQERSPALLIRLYAGNDVDTHWRMWEGATRDRMLKSGLVGDRYGDSLLKLDIDRMKARGLLFIPESARGVLHERTILWQHFDVYIPDTSKHRSEIRSLYFECLGPPTERVAPGYRCQARGEYDQLAVRADIRRQALVAGSRVFERDLKQFLDQLRVK